MENPMYEALAWLSVFIIVWGVYESVGIGMATIVFGTFTFMVVTANMIENGGG